MYSITASAVLPLACYTREELTCPLKVPRSCVRVGGEKRGRYSLYRVTLASSHLNRIPRADIPQHSSRSQSIHDAIGCILALAKLSQIKTPDLFSVPAHCSVTYNTGHSKNTARSGATPTPDGLSLVISPCVQGKSSRSPSRSSNEQCVEILQAVVRWSLGQEFVVENLAIERHTRLASYCLSG